MATRQQLEAQLAQNPGDLQAMEQLADILSAVSPEGGRIPREYIQAERYYRQVIKARGSQTAQPKLEQLLGRKALILAESYSDRGDLTLARSMVLAARLFGYRGNALDEIQAAIDSLEITEFDSEDNYQYSEN